MRGRRRLIHLWKLTGSGALLGLALLGASASAAGQTKAAEFQPGRGTLLMPKDCRQERNKLRCTADNRAIDFCRDERDANAVYVCLRANQSPLPCEVRKKTSVRQRCERMNRVYQPCKGKRGPELAACVDQNRGRGKGKK
jgi:hypothetical protein